KIVAAGLSRRAVGPTGVVVARLAGGAGRGAAAGNARAGAACRRSWARHAGRRAAAEVGVAGRYSRSPGRDDVALMAVDAPAAVWGAVGAAVAAAWVEAAFARLDARKRVGPRVAGARLARRAVPHGADEIAAGLMAGVAA